VLVVAACTGLTASQATQDVQTIASGLSAIVPDLQAVGVTVPASVTSALATLNADAGAFGTAATSAPSTTTIENDIKLVGTAVQPYYPQAPLVADLVEAAVSLGAAVLQEAGVTTAAAAAPPKYTADQARLILRSAAHR
jgi:hypothetical protein